MENYQFFLFIFWISFSFGFRLDYTISYQTQTNSLNYQLSLDTVVWFQSADLSFYVDGTWNSLTNNQLLYVGQGKYNGKDDLGSYDGHYFTWKTSQSKTEVVTRLKRYERSAAEKFIVFEVYFPNGAQNTSFISQQCNGDICYTSPNTRFPTFQTSKGYLPELGFYTWGGNMCGYYGIKKGLSDLSIHPENWLYSGTGLNIKTKNPFYLF